MALKTQYFCKKSGNYVRPEILSSKAQGGLAIVVGLDCSNLSSGCCREYGGFCRPYKKAQKDARYDNRKSAQTSAKFIPADSPDIVTAGLGGNLEPIPDSMIFRARRGLPRSSMSREAND